MLIIKYIQLIFNYWLIIIQFCIYYFRNDVEKKRKDITDDNESLISKENKKRFKSHDVKEGLTVFLKNVSFSVDNNELKRFMKDRFGSIYYALVCVDRLTEHSKGTAFVKFRVNIYRFIKFIKMKYCELLKWKYCKL